MWLGSMSCPVTTLLARHRTIDRVRSTWRKGFAAAATLQLDLRLWVRLAEVGAMDHPPTLVTAGEIERALTRGPITKNRPRAVMTWSGRKPLRWIRIALRVLSDAACAHHAIADSHVPTETIGWFVCRQLPVALCTSHRRYIYKEV
jgi:hypothetical protein